MSKEVLVSIEPLANGLGRLLAVEVECSEINRPVALQDLVSKGIKDLKLANCLVMFRLGTGGGVFPVDRFITGFP
jgi:hypothetical protein